MSKTQPETSLESGNIIGRYKELIITTIICLFLTGIYDSVNKQTEEIKRWYQLMVNLQADMRLQSSDVESIKINLDELRQNAELQLGNHENRIQDLEFEVYPPDHRRRNP